LSTSTNNKRHTPVVLAARRNVGHDLPSALIAPMSSCRRILGLRSLGLLVHRTSHLQPVNFPKTTVLLKRNMHEVGDMAEAVASYAEDIANHSATSPWRWPVLAAFGRSERSGVVDGNVAVEDGPDAIRDPVASKTGLVPTLQIAPGSP